MKKLLGKKVAPSTCMPGHCSTRLKVYTIFTTFIQKMDFNKLKFELLTLNSKTIDIPLIDTVTRKPSSLRRKARSHNATLIMIRWIPATRIVCPETFKY